MILGERLRSAPERALCRRLAGAGNLVLVSGSCARGWEHLYSDVDLVVVDDPPSTDARRGEISRSFYFVSGRRWEVERYSTAVVDQLVQAVSRASVAAAGGDDASSTINSVDLTRALRLYEGVPLLTTAGTLDHQIRLRTAGLRRLMIQLAADRCDDAVDDALGLLGADDLESSILAATMAVGHAVDALLAHHGELNPVPKWRLKKCHETAQRSPAATPPVDPEFWRRWLTSADLSEWGPRRWVLSSVAACQQTLFDIMEAE